MRGVVQIVFGHIAGCLLLFAFLTPACAQVDTPLYVGDVAPYWYRRENQTRGITYELLREASTRVGNIGRINGVPLKRQLEYVKGAPDALGAFAREPERESSYIWIAELLRDRVVLLARADSPIDISSVAAARNLRVGVMLGSPAELDARRLGFTHIETITSARSNAHKLALGRIDVWVAVLGAAQQTQADERDALPPLRIGVELEPIHFYLAGSKAFDAEQARKWKVTLDTMHRDGSYARILQKYHYVPTE
jgi:polar amino acid transport system substrate-binding protein